MNRTILLFGALLPAWLTSATAIAAASAAGKPNIILFISDQHTAEAMGNAGYAHVKTPALDSLAASGVRFRQTYCTYPVCVSSRASLMTGRWPHELKGAGEDAEEGGGRAKGKKRSTPTGSFDNPPGKSLGALMKAAGYRTAYFGKWHVGGVSPSPENRWHGFDTLVDGRRDEPAASKAIEFLEERHERPFFLVVSFLNPHDICEWARMRSGIDDKMGNGAVALEPPPGEWPPLPPNFAIPPDEPEIVGVRRNSQPTRAHPTQKWGETEWRQYRWAYARLIEKMDTQVGRVMGALKKSGQHDNTVVFYTSDHGDGHAAHHWNQKMVLYEEAVRIPLIVAWPGQTAAGRVDDVHLVSMGLDLLPTCCDYAGVSTPAGLPGRSLRPLTAPSPQPWASGGRDLVVVSEVDYRNLLPGQPLAYGHLVRTPGFAYILYSAGERPEQLFDLHADPGQTSNLAAREDYRSVVAKHRQLLREWVRETKSPFPLARIP